MIRIFFLIAYLIAFAVALWLITAMALFAIDLWKDEKRRKLAAEDEKRKQELRFK